ncbi:MAG: hypothetical protein E6Q35_09950 [Chryseobacterium cucumeris]|nr:MAG: hypothetical protein E6Q35_09950 [Chryseobacterium cucumeris]
MNTIIKRIKLIDEFCKNGKLEPFRELMTKILDEIQDRGVQVSIRYDVDFSNFEDFASDENKRIRISLKNVKDPLEVIWVLLHEYGHFLSHTRQNNDSPIAREELAWEKAEEVIKNYSELNEFSISFESCKKRCLNSYYQKYGFPLLP